MQKLVQTFKTRLSCGAQRNEVFTQKFVLSSWTAACFLQGDWVVLSVGGLWSPPPAPQVPPTHRLISISQPTFEQTKSSTGRAAPRPSAPDFSFSAGSSCFSVRLKMSVAVAESCFLSALQPNTSCTAYMVPSDGPSPDPVAKARRVQEQVRMRLAEKKSCSLPRLDDSLVGSPGEPPCPISISPSMSLHLCSLITRVWHHLRTSTPTALMKTNGKKKKSLH